MSHKHYDDEPIAPKHDDSLNAAFAARLQQAQETLAATLASYQDKEEKEPEGPKNALQLAIDENRFEEGWDANDRWSYVDPFEEEHDAEEELFNALPHSRQSYDDMPEALRDYCRSRPRRVWRDIPSQFYRDAQQLANVEDSGTIVPCERLMLPTLQDLTIPQLRSYITFRTQWRKGVRLEVSSHYIYLLIAETLMLVGVRDAEEGWQQLQEIYRTYATTTDKGRLKMNLTRWMQDFVAYYNLRHHIDEAFAREQQDDAIIEQLMLWRDGNGQGIWPLLPHISKYPLARCEAAIGDNELVQQCICNVMRDVQCHYRQKGNDIAYAYIGFPLRESYTMFSFANFYSPNKPLHYSFEINATRRYICDNGHWLLEYHQLRTFFASHMANILHETDRLLRLLVKNKCTLKAKALEPELATIVEQSIQATLQQIAASRAQAARQAAMDSIQIDMDKLQNIRHDADSVCHRLTVEEESDTVAPPATTPTTAATAMAGSVAQPPAPSPATAADSESPLATIEREYLQRLLNGEASADVLRTCHLPASVLAEAINDKLYDHFGDNVLDDSDGTPRIVDDYRDELTTLLA